MNIKKIDLNLLSVFSALMEEGNVSKVALRLGMSQPSISHALNRLRRDLNDQLFIRGPKKMIPTNRALEIFEPIQKHLQAIEELLLGTAPFDPSKAQGIIKVSSTDLFEQVHYPKIQKILAESAPNLGMLCLNVPRSFAKEELENGMLDIAVAAFFEELPNNFYKQTLYREEFVGVARAGHKIHRNPDLKNFTSYPHIVVSHTGNMKNEVDSILAKSKLKRHVSICVSNLLSPGPILKDTDCVMVCPKRIAEKFCQDYGIKIFKLPIKLKPFEVVQVWHGRVNHDPLHQWFRAQLSQLCKEY